MFRRDFKRRYGRLVIFVFLLLSCACGWVKALAQEKKDEVKRISVIKEVTGEVTWFRKNRIVIMFKRDREHGTEEEILLPMDADVRVIHKRNVDEISAGDRVMVQYEELSEEWPDGKKSSSLKAKAITFLSSGSRNVPGEGVLRSE